MSMKAQWRLLAIELRRHELWFVFLLITVLIGFFMTRTAFDDGLVLWTESSVSIRNMAAVIAPLSGAAAAWMAGRSRRRGLDDLLTTTPLPAARRMLTTWSTSALWGISAYLLVAVYILVQTARLATWDGPTFAPMIVGLLAVPAFAALGNAVGHASRQRFDALFAALGLALLLGILEGLRGWIAFLGPLPHVEQSPWYGVQPVLWLEPSIVWLGITGLALAGATLVGRRHRAGWTAAMMAAIVTAVGIGSVAAANPTDESVGFSAWMSRSETSQAVDDGPTPRPYTPVCSDDPISVCVHPAYEAILDDLSPAVNRMIALLAGRPGLPVRAEQRPWRALSQPDGVTSFELRASDVETNLTMALRDIAQNLLFNPATFTRDGPPDAFEAQAAIQTWLLIDAGVPVRCEGDMARAGSLGWSPASCAEAMRFAALDPATRTAWLQTHWDELRTGRIGLDDLP